MSIKYAVFGGGPVVSEFYIPAFSRMNHESLKIVVEPNVEINKNIRCSGFANEIINKTFDSSWRELEKHSDIKAIIIALPNFLHELAALEALNRGYNVLIEKPVALTIEGCRKIHNLAVDRCLVAAAGMVRRNLPGFMAMREAIKMGVLGTIESIEIEDGEYYPWLSDSGFFFRPESGGILADMGVHYLDMIYQLFGRLTPISYQDDWKGGVEANCELDFFCSGSINARLKLSRDRKLGNFFIINGSAGKLVLNKENHKACFFYPNKTNLVSEIKIDAPFFSSKLPVDFVSSFCQQLNDFESAISGESDILSSAGDAADVMGMIEWCYKSRLTPDRLSKEGTANSNSHLSPVLPSGPILVTGGSGFIGGKLIECLWNSGHRDITAPVRSYKRVVELARFGVEMPRVDLLNPLQVAKEMAGKRWVVHLAYGNDGTKPGRFTFDSTKIVVDEAIKAGVEAIVVLSTAWVYGLSESPEIVSENSPYRPFGQSDYASSKLKMEKWVLDRAKKSNNTRIVILNPTCVWGIQGKTYTRLPYQLAKKNQFCWIDNGTGLANVVKVESLIDAMVLALTIEDAHGQSFIINDEVMTWKNFLTPLLGPFVNSVPSLSSFELKKICKKKYTTFKDLAKIIAGSTDLKNALADIRYLGEILKWFGKKALTKTQKKTESIMPELVVDQCELKPPLWINELYGSYQTVFNADKAKKNLGWAPRLTTQEYLKTVQNWILSVEKI